MSDAGRPKIEFAPGCFDEFEGTAEELADLIDQLYEMVESGELFETAEPLTPEDEVDLSARMNRTKTRH